MVVVSFNFGLININLYEEYVYMSLVENQLELDIYRNIGILLFEFYITNIIADLIEIEIL